MIRLAQCKFKFTSNGYGIVNPIKVRVYHRFWKWLLPAKVKLDWNDDDAMPFVFVSNNQTKQLEFGNLVINA